MAESLRGLVRLEPNEAFATILASAVTAPTEVTLAELLGCFPEQADSFLIDRVSSVSRLLDLYRLETLPSIKDGEPDTVRILRLSVTAAHTFDSIRREAADGESGSLEFKSSFEFDHKKARFAPDTPTSQLQSQAVRWAFLKSVAALLNGAGGVLLGGVNDQGECIGIQHDFPFLKTGHQNSDGWQLHVRDVIGSSFGQGASVRDYIQISTAEGSEGRVVARVAVTARKRLSFLFDAQKKHYLYCRQGNLTREVLIQDIEEFLEQRWGLAK